MKTILTTLFVSSLLILPFLSRAQSQRGQGVKSARPAISGKYYALLIGVQKYQHPSVNPLDYPLSDVAQVQQELTTEYNFEPQNVSLLPNPDREMILAALDQLAEKLGTNDCLLIFYAGHGYWDEQRRQGYWLPSDAQRGNRAKWISNSDLRDAIRAIKARHTMLISDACFSGGLFVTREAFVRPAAIEEVDRLPSRTAMTSGALTTVPDRSVFVSFLLKRLRENSEPYLMAGELFSQLRAPVINNSPRQQDGAIPTPRYGVIQEAGDEGGDFIFVRRSTAPSVGSNTANPIAAELSFWESIKNSNKAEDFRAYLLKYPNGQFAALARIRVDSIEPPTSPIKPTPAEPIISEGEQKAIDKIHSAGGVAEKLKAASEYLKKNGKSQMRPRVAAYVSGEIAEVTDHNQRIGFVENFTKAFNLPEEADLIKPTLIESLIGLNKLEEAFKEGSKHIERKPDDVIVLTQVAWAGANLARAQFQSNQRPAAAMVQKATAAGAKAVEMLESDKKPEAMEAAVWKSLRHSWLPLLYQAQGVILYVNNDKAGAKDRLGKAASLDPYEPSTLVTLSDILNGEYLKLSERYQAEKSESLLNEALQKMDELIDWLARAAAATEGNAKYQAFNAHVMNQLKTYYSYRHEGKTDGLAEMIKKYKKP
jgi:hypothetical protein